MGNQVNVLQTVIQQLPAMIVPAVEQMLGQVLPQAIDDAIMQVLTARLQGLVGTTKGAASAPVASSTQVSASSEKSSSGKKTKKSKGKHSMFNCFGGKSSGHKKGPNGSSGSGSSGLAI
ncbi:hypothetical protein F4778DRAFT_766544 [Xylariomycetidae sp. FL2044]|nr:hypothetical protein F4778DRAFT_766544 [Xylariomycetidae sp. FL2044]